ncbi:MAG TPA: hypothetical protein VFS33_07575 [Gemmatimonadales bacterium]|nr:hypothetical protein [Gemmatimonadales bacterium]
MSHAMPVPTQSVPESRGQRGLWFGLFGAAVAWSVQELANYALSAYACSPPGLRGAVPRVTGIRAWELILSGVLLIVALAAGWTAVRDWRAARPEQGGAGRHLEIGEGRVAFMAFAGILLSAIFLLAIVMNLISVIMVPPCQ